MTYQWPEREIQRFVHDPHRRLTGLVPRVKTSELQGTCGGGGDGVTSIAKQGDSQITTDATLSEGTNITLTQTGQDIEIASAGGTSFDETYGSLYYVSPCLLPAPMIIANVGPCDANYVKVASVLTPLVQGSNENTTPDPVNGTITTTGGSDGMYIVHFNASLFGEVDTAKVLAVFLNGTATDIKARHYQVTVLDTLCVKAEGILELDAADVLDVRITNSGLIAEDIGFYSFQFSILRIA